MSVEDSYIEDLEIDLEREQMVTADLRARLAAVEAENERLRSLCVDAYFDTWHESETIRAAICDVMAIATPADAGKENATKILKCPLCAENMIEWDDDWYCDTCKRVLTLFDYEPRHPQEGAAESPGTSPGGST
jgi:hypothetical protein